MSLTRRALRARKDTMTDHKPAEPVLSKNLAFGSIALIVVLGVVGVVLLHLFRPDASATFIQTIVTFAGILTVAITTIYGLGKLGDRVEVVQRQTNGTLSELRAEVLRKEGVIQQLHGEKVELARQLPATAAVDETAYREYRGPAAPEPPAPR